MKKLFCLRHAEALVSGHGDHERCLSRKGQEDAQMLGKTMMQRGYIPDLVLCSTAIRTRMTWDPLAALFPECAIRYEQKLYGGTLEDYLMLVQATEPEVCSVLVVGHNPNIHAFSVSLAKEDNSSMLNDIMHRYTPCTLSVFDVEVEEWQGLAFQRNRLVDVVMGEA